MTGDAKEQVVVSTFVELPPSEAFAIFTRDIDLWWKRSPRYRQMPGQAGSLRFEGEPPERLVEHSAKRRAVIGRVLSWEPGARVSFEWSTSELAEHDRTSVEVRFQAHRHGTRVTLEHHGLAALPAKHPARRGLSGGAFAAMFGYFWADLLASFRMHAR